MLTVFLRANMVNNDSNRASGWTRGEAVSAPRVLKWLGDKGQWLGILILLVSLIKLHPSCSLGSISEGGRSSAAEPCYLPSVKIRPNSTKLEKGRLAAVCQEMVPQQK